MLQRAGSYVVSFLRLAGSDLGRIVADVIKANSAAPANAVADRVIAHLARLNVTSTYWPGDDEVRAALMNESAYRRYPRARLRAFLEAIENNFRAETGQPQVERAGFPIEHILPQKWMDNWPVVGLEAEQARRERVHRLGNLTLLTSGLNSKLCHSPWVVKRRALLEHNTIKLTGRLLAQTENSEWCEELIDRRTSDLADAILRVWAVPHSHSGQVVDPQTKAQDWVQLKHLIEAGPLTSGEKLLASHRDFSGVEATVGADGHITVDGRRFESPSGAAKHVRKRVTNGWYFWTLADGRRLRDVRAEFLAAAPGAIGI
ncbi:DUF1524 domain-containing protein [Kribbella sp. NPDC056861]|uniref:GmrSD restriction endonuclease domain-containing protein n=1 Tax=Kribbella sp. NPDC056861 TaxID=3154857 RepID=UPI003424B628